MSSMPERTVPAASGASCGVGVGVGVGVGIGVGVAVGEATSVGVGLFDDFAAVGVEVANRTGLALGFGV
jgi:hypothetical protein